MSGLATSLGAKWRWWPEFHIYLPYILFHFPGVKVHFRCCCVWLRGMLSSHCQREHAQVPESQEDNNGVSYSWNWLQTIFSSSYLVKLIVNRCDLARMDGNDVSEWEDIDWQKTNETVVENNIICDRSESFDKGDLRWICFSALVLKSVLTATGKNFICLLKRSVGFHPRLKAMKNALLHQKQPGHLVFLRDKT